MFSLGKNIIWVMLTMIWYQTLLSCCFNCGLVCRDGRECVLVSWEWMLDYMRWNGNDSLIDKLWIMFYEWEWFPHGWNIKFVVIVTPLDWYPVWFNFQRHGLSVYGRCMGVWSYFAIGHWHGRHRPWLRCYHVGLVNPNMVASCHIRKYMNQIRVGKWLRHWEIHWNEK